MMVLCASMMRRRILGIGSGLALGVLLWPWLGNPMNYVHWRDRVRTTIPVALAFGFPCETRSGNSISVDTSPACLKYEQPREYRGIWLYKFEESTFIEGAKVPPPSWPPGATTAWLSYEPGRIVPKASIKNLECQDALAFRVRFVGQERAGPAGHMGIWNKQIWPSNILQVEPIPLPNCAGKGLAD